MDSKIDKKYNIIVAHPGKQHSFELAEALKKEGLLFKYITTVYLKDKSITKIIYERLLKGNSFKKAATRKSLALDDNDVLQINEFYGLITLLLSRIHFLKKIYLHWSGWVASNFYKKVMKYAKLNKVDAVIVYDGYSNKHFEILNESNIIKIMDVSIAARKYLKNIFKQEIEKYNVKDIKAEHYEYWNPKMAQNDIKAISESDYFLVPSEFVKNSLVYCGINKKRIQKVPYGVNVNKFKPNYKSKSDNNLNLIYVGQINYRKGIHHLLKVVSSMKNVNLSLCGVYDENSMLYQKYKNNKNIKFEGFITRDILEKKYQEADVFVLASLGEGLALVGLEALACGLPLICTENTGVNDIIINYENGIVIPTSNEDALYDAINWFICNLESLPQIKKKARESALKYTWENYHTNVIVAIENIMKNREKK